MSDLKAVNIYAKAAEIGFLVGFGFTFLIYLKSFLTGETGFFALIPQFFVASLVGGFTMLIATVFAAPFMMLVALFGDPKK